MVILCLWTKQTGSSRDVSDPYSGSSWTAFRPEQNLWLVVVYLGSSKHMPWQCYNQAFFNSIFTWHSMYDTIQRETLTVSLNKPQIHNNAQRIQLSLVAWLHNKHWTHKYLQHTSGVLHPRYKLNVPYKTKYSTYRIRFHDHYLKHFFDFTSI